MTVSKTEEKDPFDLDETDDTKVNPGAAAAGPEVSEPDDEDDEDDDEDEDEDDSVDQAALDLAAQEAAKEAREQSAAEARRKRTAARAPATIAPEPMSAMRARIKPFHEKRGQTMRTHSLNYDGHRATFVEGRGWYEVPHGLADHLRTVRCSDMDPDSNLAFDVCTEREARRMDEQSEAALELQTRATAHRPRSALST